MPEFCCQQTCFRVVNKTEIVDIIIKQILDRAAQGK
jgi:hypothetical protein